MEVLVPQVGGDQALELTRQNKTFENILLCVCAVFTVNLKAQSTVT